MIITTTIDLQSPIFPANNLRFRQGVPQKWQYEKDRYLIPKNFAPYNKIRSNVIIRVVVLKQKYEKALQYLYNKRCQSR